MFFLLFGLSVCRLYPFHIYYKEYSDFSIYIKKKTNSLIMRLERDMNFLFILTCFWNVTIPFLISQEDQVDLYLYAKVKKCK